MEIVNKEVKVTVSVGGDSIDCYEIRYYHNVEFETDDFSLTASGIYGKKMRQVFEVLNEFLENEDCTEMEVC